MPGQPDCDAAIAHSDVRACSAPVDLAGKPFLDEKPTSSSTEVTRLYQPRQVTARKKDSFTTPGNWVTDELYNPTFLTGIFSRFPTQRTEHDGASAPLSSAALRLGLRIVAAA